MLQLIYSSPKGGNNGFLKHFQKEITKRGLTENTISLIQHISYILTMGNIPSASTPSQVKQRSEKISLMSNITNESLTDDELRHRSARFFTMYVLHGHGIRHSFCPQIRHLSSFVPTQNEVKTFISTTTDIKQKAA